MSPSLVWKGCAALTMVLAASAWAGSAPDLTGIWKPAGRFSAEIRTLDGGVPPLRPEAAALYEKRKAQYRAGDRSFDNASTLCVSAGVPRVMALPYPFQIVQRPHQMVFLFEWNGRHRIVDLGNAPPDPPDLFYMGTAWGKVDAQALVIETRGLTSASLLDASGMPHSEGLVVTERLHLADGGRMLINDMTIDDAATFSKSWKTRVTYRRMPAGAELKEDVCREHTLAGRTAFPGIDSR